MIKINEEYLTLLVGLLIGVAEVGGAGVEGDLLVLLAGHVDLLVELGSLLVHLHQLVEGADLEDSFVHLIQTMIIKISLPA